MKKITATFSVDEYVLIEKYKEYCGIEDFSDALRAEFEVMEENGVALLDWRVEKPEDKHYAVMCDIPPCAVGDTLYRRWTCGGRETVAQFTVTRISKSGGEWEIEFQSAHSSKWSRPVVRHCKESDIGKKIFLSAEKASKEKIV